MKGHADVWDLGHHLGPGRCPRAMLPLGPDWSVWPVLPPTVVWHWTVCQQDISSVVWASVSNLENKFRVIIQPLQKSDSLTIKLSFHNTWISKSGYWLAELMTEGDVGSLELCVQSQNQQYFFRIDWNYRVKPLYLLTSYVQWWNSLCCAWASMWEGRTCSDIENL